MAAGRRKKVWGVEFSVVRSQMFVVVCLHLQEAAEQIYSHLQTEVKLKKQQQKNVFRHLQVILNQHLDIKKSLPSIFFRVLAQPDRNKTQQRDENKQTNIPQLRTTKGQFYSR